MFTVEQFYDSLMLAIGFGFMLGMTLACIKGIARKGGERK